jgi:hypothetical protein
MLTDEDPELEEADELEETLDGADDGNDERSPQATNRTAPKAVNNKDF